MRTLLSLAFLCGLLLLLARCEWRPGPAELHLRHCGSCHLPPDPASLPRAVWEASVLPEMGARLGIATLDYSPENILGAEEYALAYPHYPKVPQLSQDEWRQLHGYILDRAPDSLLTPDPLVTDSLREWTPRAVAVERKPGALVTYLGSSPTGGLLVGDGYANLTHWRAHTGSELLAHTRAPIVHYQPHPDGDLLLEIGNIYPTGASNGRLLRLTDGGAPTVIADSLHRPVHFLATDLDGDTTDEFIVCEYGNYTGILSLLRRQADGSYRKQKLVGRAGALRVVADDINGDGLTDLVVLYAQGNEGIEVLYQNEEGGFTDRTSLLRFPAVWGTSWFELADIDGDGIKDLLTVHGDNADYSNLPKPYHGLRIWRGERSGEFTEAYFLSLPGATRLVARDFDRDGHIDVAVACNFADFARQPGASFVYLHNRGGATLDFSPQTTPAARSGRWLILEALDYDLDGDEDLALGSFTLNPAPVPGSVADRWATDSVDVLLLINDLTP